MLVLLSEYVTASCAKSSPPFALSYTSRARASRASICSGAAVTGTEIRMCETLYSAFWSGAFCCARHELLELARRDIDAADDVALTQQLQRHLAADLVAEGAIVDALLRERLRQVGEADAVALGDVVERAVQHFVGHLNAERSARCIWISSTTRRSRICRRSTLRGGSSVFCWRRRCDDLLGLLVELAGRARRRR